MTFFPYSDLTSTKSPIAIIFLSAFQLVLRPKLKKLFGEFFFTRINGKRYLFRASCPVKWTEGIGRSREFHFFTLDNGNSFSPELLNRIGKYKKRNKIAHFTSTLFAVSSDMRTNFKNALKVNKIPKLADAVEKLKKEKEQILEEDIALLSQELGITVADFLLTTDMPKDHQEKLLQTLAKEGLTHVVEPIDTGIINDLKNFRSFAPEWFPTVLTATQQTELEHKRMEARASKGFNKLILMIGFSFIIVVMITAFVATNDLSFTLPSLPIGGR